LRGSSARRTVSGRRRVVHGPRYCTDRAKAMRTAVWCRTRVGFGRPGAEALRPGAADLRPGAAGRRSGTSAPRRAFDRRARRPAGRTSDYFALASRPRTFQPMLGIARSRPWPLVAALLAVASPAAAQQPETEYTGATALGLALRRLGPTQRVLMIAAHPDDENTSVLATLALGGGADVAYLSITRGDGGQNGIGPELQESIGLIRS